MMVLVAPIGALLIGVSLLLLGGGLLNTLLAVRGGLEGYSSSTMGYIMSGYFVGFFLGTYLALPLVQRIGHIRAFALCAALASCCSLLHAVLVNPLAWILLRVVSGVVLVILYTVIESWLNGQATGEKRGQVFAVYMVVNLTSLALAQQLLRLDSPTTFILFTVSAILISFSLVPITWTRLAQPETSAVSKIRIKKLLKIAPVAVAGALLSGLAMGAFWGMSAVYAGKIGLNSEGTATFISCAIIGGAILQFPLGRYSDTHDRRKVLAVISLVAVAAALLLAALSFAGQWVLVAIAAYGGMAFAIYPVAVAHLVDHLDSADILSGGSGLLLLHGIGAAIGPALSGQLMELMGAQALPLYFAGIHAVLALYAVRKMHVVKEDTLEYPTQFVAMVRTTPTVLEMLPDEGIVLSEPEDVSTEVTK